MKILRLAVALLFAPSLCLPAQTPGPAKDQPPASTEPFIADVHASPYRSTIYYRTNIGSQRFDMRDATLLDMIALAYGRQDEAVIGGPTWLDFDRFDIVAKISSLKPVVSSPDPANQANAHNPYDEIRPVLKQVLTDRFHLAYHIEDRPLPGYVMTVAKEGSKLTEAKDATAANNCQYAQDKAVPGQATMTCTSTTIAQLTSFGIFPHPVIDHTGLTKSYDFTMKLAFNNLHSQEDYVRAYSDAYKQQLGLVVTPGDVPQPAIVVDKVDHAPTPNQPDVAKLIPTPPDTEFEVATIKTPAETEPHGGMQVRGSQMTFSAMSVQELIVRGWNLATGAMIGNAPPWLDHVRYTVLVKLPPAVDARAIWQDQDQLARMMQKMLIDRFQIKSHWGEQTGDGYVLLAGTPKMKKADPTSRTSCGFGAPPGEKDPRTAPNSPYDRGFYCRNVTMAQFADVLQSLAGSDIKNRVPDRTGLAGAYDFTVLYTSSHKLKVDAIAAADAASRQTADAAAKQTADAASEPTGGVSLEDAFRKQLGLRVEKQSLTGPSLILDHIEQKPTEN